MKKNQLLQKESANGKTAYAIYCEECGEFSGCEVDGIEKCCPTPGRCHDSVCPNEQGYRMVLKLGVCPVCCCIDKSFMSEDGLHIPMPDKEICAVLL